MASSKMMDFRSEQNYCYFYLENNTGKLNLELKHYLDFIFAKYNKSQMDVDSDSDDSDTSSLLDVSYEENGSESSDDSFIVFQDEDKNEEDKDRVDEVDKSVNPVEDMSTSSDSDSDDSDTSSQSDTSYEDNTSESSDDSFIVFQDDENEDNDEVDEVDGSVNDDDEDMSTSSDEDSVSPHNKKVQFNTKPQRYMLYTWSYAYRKAREDLWSPFARDRMRFKRRIDRTAATINEILTPTHRAKIFKERFCEKQTSPLT